MTTKQSAMTATMIDLPVEKLIDKRACPKLSNVKPRSGIAAVDLTPPVEDGTDPRHRLHRDGETPRRPARWL